MKQQMATLMVGTAVVGATVALFVATPWALSSFVAWTHTLPQAVARSLTIALPVAGAALLALVTLSRK